MENLIPTAVVAALISAAVSYLTARASLRAGRRRDRFDRLFPPLHEMHSELFRLRKQRGQVMASMRRHDSQGNSDSLVRGIIEFQSISARMAEMYVERRPLIDGDLQKRVEPHFLKYAEADGKRRPHKVAVDNVNEEMPAYKAMLEAQEAFAEHLISTVEEQVARLRRL